MSNKILQVRGDSVTGTAITFMCLLHCMEKIDPHLTPCSSDRVVTSRVCIVHQHINTTQDRMSGNRKDGSTHSPLV